MPFPFRLPTTSLVALQNSVSSESHPSLPLAATTSRGVVRTALKKYKRLRPSSQSSQLPEVLASLNNYIPFLLAIDAGLGRRSLGGEVIDVVLRQEVIVQWRAILTAGIPGREPPRVTLQSLEYEILSTLSAFAASYYLAARSSLLNLYDAATPTSEQRATAISAAMKHLLDSHGVYSYLAHRSSQIDAKPPIPDVAPSTFSALASLSLAEATLLAVFKDDPYPAAVTQERNKHDKEWMYKAPEISSVRASLFARICIAAAEHVSKALGMIGHSNKIIETLPKYMDNVRRTARAKACRFLGIDAELAGKTGEAIGWLRAAQQALGLTSNANENEKMKVFSKLKKDLAEKLEDRKVEKGQEWGTDAGRLEEARVVDMLLAKWTKMNSLMNIQTVPSTDSLITKMPSGREFHSPKAWVLPILDPITLSTLRVPPSPDGLGSQRQADEDDSDDELSSTAPGAFPGTERSYANGTSYY